MTEPIPYNNEFNAAENALRDIGSNLWFAGLSDEWQDFLVANTVECFDTYQVTMHEAANAVIGLFQQIVNADPSVLQSDPLEINITMNN